MAYITFVLPLRRGGGVRSVVLLDGVCVLCNAFAHFVGAWDSRDLVQMASLQSVAGREMLHAHGLEAGEGEKKEKKPTSLTYPCFKATWIV